MQILMGKSRMKGFLKAYFFDQIRCDSVGAILVRCGTRICPSRIYLGKVHAGQLKALR